MTHVCNNCSHRTGQWMGFCPQCKEHGSMHQVGETDRLRPVGLVESESEITRRWPTGVAEFDHVLGGGVVDGAAILLGGDPGVGKSTLLLQLAAAASVSDPVLVVTGEESVGQVGIRARRIGVAADGVRIAVSQEVAGVAASIESGDYRLVIVDSIQTLVDRDLDGLAGGIAQVRGCAARLIEASKRSATPVIMIGHVTKEGSLAGPKVVEHMVDVLMHLDSDDSQGLRFLRCTKNRFGSTDRVGIFEMSEFGLVEVLDPVGCLTDGWQGLGEGTVLFPTMLGKRPLLVEVQALVVSSKVPQPRRSFKGLEAARVHQVLAVLEKQTGLAFSNQEVYVSLAGGVKVGEPASDLPVALALVSSRMRIPLGKTAAWGEVGLTGEVREVGRSAARSEEVARLGLDRIVTPQSGGSRLIDALSSARLLAEEPV